MILRAACASIYRITASLVILLLAVVTLQARQADAYATPDRPALENRMIAADGVVAQQRTLIRAQPVQDDPVDLAVLGIIRHMSPYGPQDLFGCFSHISAKPDIHDVLPPSHGPPAV
tara:strand:+ start:319 stop:669 length:351 start_codon:yes stop_codon:yes gene_type:complete